MPPPRVSFVPVSLRVFCLSSERRFCLQTDAGIGIVRADFGTARCFARQLSDEYSAELLEQTLDEEKATDQQLTKIAEGSVNPASAHHQR